jgi:hypothetical protein
MGRDAPLLEVRMALGGGRPGLKGLTRALCGTRIRPRAADAPRSAGQRRASCSTQEPIPAGRERLSLGGDRAAAGNSVDQARRPRRMPTGPSPTCQQLPHLPEHMTKKSVTFVGPSRGSKCCGRLSYCSRRFAGQSARGVTSSPASKATAIWVSGRD